MMQDTLRGLVLFLTLTVCPGAFSQDCEQEQLIQCAFPLKQFTDNKELGFYTSKEELEKMCPQLRDGLRCIDDFTSRCMTPGRRNYFNKLYAGTHSVITELCENGSYQEEFLRHRPCMLGVRKEHEECTRGYQEKIRTAPGVGAVGGARSGESEEGGGGGVGGGSGVSAEESAKYLRTVCCSFQAYLQCSKQVVLEKCGSETAKFTERFLDRMAFPLLENHCEGYHVGSDKCEDYFSSPSSTTNPSLRLSLLSFLLPLLLLRTLFPST